MFLPLGSGGVARSELHTTSATGPVAGNVFSLNVTNPLKGFALPVPRRACFYQSLQSYKHFQKHADRSVIPLD